MSELKSHRAWIEHGRVPRYQEKPARWLLAYREPDTAPAAVGLYTIDQTAAFDAGCAVISPEKWEELKAEWRREQITQIDVSDIEGPAI